MMRAEQGHFLGMDVCGKPTQRSFVVSPAVIATRTASGIAARGSAPRSATGSIGRSVKAASRTP